MVMLADLVQDVDLLVNLLEWFNDETNSLDSHDDVLQLVRLFSNVGKTAEAHSLHLT